MNVYDYGNRTCFNIRYRTYYIFYDIYTYFYNIKCNILIIMYRITSVVLLVVMCNIAFGYDCKIRNTIYSELYQPVCIVCGISKNIDTVRWSYDSYLYDDYSLGNPRVPYTSGTHLSLRTILISNFTDAHIGRYMCRNRQQYMTVMVYKRTVHRYSQPPASIACIAPYNNTVISSVSWSVARLGTRSYTNFVMIAQVHYYTAAVNDGTDEELSLYIYNVNETLSYMCDLQIRPARWISFEIHDIHVYDININPVKLVEST